MYALSLCAAVLLVAVADRAGESADVRWTLLLSYLLGLAGALHLDALLAAPAAILLATSVTGERALCLRAIARWAGPVLLALGLAQASRYAVLAALAVSVGLMLIPLPDRSRREDALRLLLVALGASSALYLLVRAGHDPGINQGDPSTWSRFLGVLARDQYDVPGLWPRRAPLWLQAANVIQYLDWQFAFGIGGRGFSPGRAAVTAGYLALAWVGAREHWKRDVRTARAWLTFVLVAAVGAMVVLNLKAGPSIGWGLLPPDAGHEARERDYFFTGAFVGVAAWSATGIAVLARRTSASLGRYAPLAIAILLFGGNLAATNRRRQPDARLPVALADALFASAPPNAVLLLAGDNDTYAVWQGQQVRGLRRDLVPVTLPLLGADWYRAELGRRYGLLDRESIGEWQGGDATLRALRSGAGSAHRPFAVALSVSSDTRRRLEAGWRLRGLVLVADSAVSGIRVAPDHQGIANRIAGSSGQSPAHDATARYVQRLLKCPASVEMEAIDSVRSASLDSVCNLR